MPSITAILAQHSEGQIARSSARRQIANQLRGQGASTATIRWLLNLPRLLSVRPPYNRWRARYLSEAASRLTRAQVSTEATTQETRWYRQHLQANRARKAQAERIRTLTQEHGAVLGWKAEIDSSTTPECRTRHGKNFRVRNPPQGQLPGTGTHAGCFPAGVAVSGPEPTASMTRWWSGELVEIQTRDGRVLPCTPNHPILTPNGWVAAGDLVEGSEILTQLGTQRSFPNHPHDHEQPSLIEDVARTLGEDSPVLSRVVPVSSEDFHGDGTGSDVAVIRSDSLLLDEGNRPARQPLTYLGFQRAHLRQRALTSLSHTTRLAKRTFASTCGLMRRMGVVAVLGLTPLAHHHLVSLDRTTYRNVVTLQDTTDHPTSHSPRLSDRVLTLSLLVSRAYAIGIQIIPFVRRSTSLPRLASTTPRPPLLEPTLQDSTGDTEARDDLSERDLTRLVERDRVVQLRRIEWSGHVYNLQTETGWYVANGIIVHNCRCEARRPYPDAEIM